jgi:hypothetical protein
LSYPAFSFDAHVQRISLASGSVDNFVFHLSDDPNVVGGATVQDAGMFGVDVGSPTK